MIEKILEMLETLYSMNEKTKNTAYEEQDWEKFDLVMHRNEGVYFATKIVQEVAKEYEEKACVRCKNHVVDADLKPCKYCIHLVKHIYKEDNFEPKPAPYQKGE